MKTVTTAEEPPAPTQEPPAPTQEPPAPTQVLTQEPPALPTPTQVLTQEPPAPTQVPTQDNFRKGVLGDTATATGSTFLAGAQLPSAAQISGRVFPLQPNTKLVIKRGDVTKEDVDAIVNAANERMLGGGGVDGAIHRAAGPQLVRACAEVPEVRPGVRCPTGEARITPGFHLKARYVIHTVGPIYESRRYSEPLLTAAYRSSIELALQNQLKSISFPSISTGVFGYPYNEAAESAVTAVRKAVEAAGEAGSVKEVRFVLFSDELFNIFVETAEKIGKGAAAPARPTRTKSL